MRRRLLHRAQQIIDVARYARRASPAYRVGAVTLFARTVPICLKHQFSGAEAYRLGLFDPTTEAADLSHYCSRKHLTKIQRSLNPPSLEPLLRNKAIFYQFCLAHGIPVPALYAVVFGPTRGWTYSDRLPARIEQWTAFMDRDLPAEFVIKPVEAAFGHGVMLFRRQGDRFIDPTGATFHAAALWEKLCTNGQHDGFLIQERLHNHPRLLELTGVEYLQTVRMTTLVDADRRAHVIHAACKLIAGSNVTDNFHGGITGNIQACVDFRDGRLSRPVTASANTPGYNTLRKHPNTGLDIEGFHLPLWDQACTLVREIALRFLPVRTIGWDVALTPSGPMIVEGNIWWNPPNQHRNLHTILQTIRELCPFLA